MVRRRPGPRLLLAAVAAERVAEMILAERHRRWSLRAGGSESGAGHYPVMVALHTGMLAGCAVHAVRRTPARAARSMVGLVLAAQALRWWCIAALGRQWNTRIIVIPGARRCRNGPYRWLRHPNYLAVVVEGVALPLAFGAARLAAAFTAANAVLLAVRIRAENRALGLLAASERR